MHTNDVQLSNFNKTICFDSIFVTYVAVLETIHANLETLTMSLFSDIQ